MFYISLGIILLGGFIIGFILDKIHIPGFIGMIMLGLLLGPTILNIIDPTILSVSSQLRQLALVIILTRSGLNLDLRGLKKSWLFCHFNVLFTSNIRNGSCRN